MSKRNLTHIPDPRLVWRSAEGRVEVYRWGACDYETRCDGHTLCSVRSQAEAEHAGAMWLHEQAKTAERRAP